MVSFKTKISENTLLKIQDDSYSFFKDIEMTNNFLHPTRIPLEGLNKLQEIDEESSLKIG